MLSPDAILNSNDVIKSRHVDWGLLANQISAGDIPIEDAAGWLTATNVETALAEISSFVFNSARECIVSVTFPVDDPVKQRFKTVQAAIDYAQAQTPTAAARWLIIVKTGVYTETLTLYDYIHFRGEDKHTCVIENSASIMSVDTHETSFSELTFRATGIAEIFNIASSVTGPLVNISDCIFEGNGSNSTRVTIGTNGAASFNRVKVDNAGFDAIVGSADVEVFILTRCDIRGNIVIAGGEAYAIECDVLGQAFSGGASTSITLNNRFENPNGDTVVFDTSGGFTGYQNIVVAHGPYYSLKVTTQPTAGNSVGNIFTFVGSVPAYSVFATVPFFFGGFNNAYQRGHNGLCRNITTKVRTVSSQWAEYPTITAALEAAIAGDTILLSGGTYSEQLTVAVDDLTIRAEANDKVFLTQVDASVIDFGTTTGGSVENVTLSITAPTVKRSLVSNTLGGSFSVRNCVLTMSVAASISGDQPRLIDAGGTVVISRCEYSYSNTGTATVSDLKVPFEVNTIAGSLELAFCRGEISGSGTSRASAFAYGKNGGTLVVRNCKAEVEDDTADAYGVEFAGTATDNLLQYSDIKCTVSAGSGDAIGAIAADESSVRTSHNVLVCTSIGGDAYSHQVETDASMVANFDEVVAADIVNVIGSGFFEYIITGADGQLTVSRTFVTNEKGMEMCPSDRIWDASDPVNGIAYSSTYTIATSTIGNLIAFGGTAQFSVNGSATDAGKIFNNDGIFQNVPGTGNSFGVQCTFVNKAVYQADNGTISSLAIRMAFFQPTFQGINGGSLSITSAVAALHWDPNVAAGATITSLRGIDFTGGSTAGVITTNTYIRMANHSGGTTRYGIESLVNTPGIMLLHSGSGDLQITNESANLDISQYLRHFGDTDTYLQFTADRARVAAGGNIHVDLNGTSLNLATALGNLGFHGATAVAQQTIVGSRKQNIALTALLVALANLGLIVDATTA